MDQFEGLRKKLELESWPKIYMFKFIGEPDRLDQLKYLFQSAEVSIRASSKGKYQAFTAKMLMLNVEDIIHIYEEASKIKGVVAL